VPTAGGPGSSTRCEECLAPYAYTTAAAYLNDSYSDPDPWLVEAAAAADGGDQVLERLFREEARAVDLAEKGTVSLTEATEAGTRLRDEWESRQERPTRIEVARRICEILEDGDMQGREWAKGDRVRVYVTRRLSRGRQEMGHISIESDGSRDYSEMSRRKAGVRDLVEEGLDN